MNFERQSHYYRRAESTDRNDLPRWTDSNMTSARLDGPRRRDQHRQGQRRLHLRLSDLPTQEELNEADAKVQQLGSLLHRGNR